MGCGGYAKPSRPSPPATSVLHNLRSRSKSMFIAMKLSLTGMFPTLFAACRRLYLSPALQRCVQVWKKQKKGLVNSRSVHSGTSLHRSYANALASLLLPAILSFSDTSISKELWINSHQTHTIRTLWASLDSISNMTAATTLICGLSPGFCLSTSHRISPTKFMSTQICQCNDRNSCLGFSSQ